MCIRDRLTTPIAEVEHLLRSWCHVIGILEEIGSKLKLPIVHLITDSQEFNRSRSLLANSLVQYVDAKFSSYNDTNEVYFTVKELFQQFENGTYAQIRSLKRG